MLQEVLISAFVYLQYNRAYLEHFWQAVPIHNVFLEIVTGSIWWLNFIFSLRTFLFTYKTIYI